MDPLQVVIDHFGNRWCPTRGCMWLASTKKDGSRKESNLRTRLQAARRFFALICSPNHSATTATTGGQNSPFFQISKGVDRSSGAPDSTRSLNPLSVKVGE
ncbi:hypothetical protein TNCV_4812181 [Trichonephila clavipes]|nr:hypothetical protein TNCV_4812181 [Trichonephila clavipes]